MSLRCDFYILHFMGTASDPQWGPPRQRAWVPVSGTQNKASATQGCVVGVQNTSWVTRRHRLGLRVEDRSEQTKTWLCGLDFLTDVHLIFLNK